MGTVAHVEFTFSDDVEAFSFTTDNSGHTDQVGLIIAKTIYNSDIVNFLRLSTNVLAKVSSSLPKRTAVVPDVIKNEESYKDSVNYFYKIKATDKYEDWGTQVRDAILIIITKKSGEVVFKGYSEELLTRLENGETL